MDIIITHSNLRTLISSEAEKITLHSCPNLIRILAPNAKVIVLQDCPNLSSIVCPKVNQLSLGNNVEQLLAQIKQMELLTHLRICQPYIRHPEVLFELNGKCTIELSELAVCQGIMNLVRRRTNSEGYVGPSFSLWIDEQPPST